MESRRADSIVDEFSPADATTTRDYGGVVGLIEKGGLNRESLLTQFREQVAATRACGT